MTTSISNTFSFSRLLMVMKRDLVENWKSDFNELLSLYGAFLISALMSYVTINDMVDSSVYFSYRLGFYIATGLITYFIFHIAAGNVMSVLHTKEKRISYLMLPATKAEKFVSRAIQAIVGTLVKVIIALFLAEITRLMLFPLLGAPEALQQFCLFDFNDIFLKGSFLNGIENIENRRLMYLAVFNVFSGIMVTHSLFILGGTYFYKRPIIKTFGWIILGITALSFIAGYFGTRSYRAEIDETTLIIASTTFNLFIATICWGLSYFLFTRSQVTERVNFKFLKRK